MSDPRPDADTLERAARIDGLCDRFESLWQAGGRPSAAEFLRAGGVDPDTADPDLMRELGRVEAHYRAAGDQPEQVAAPPGQALREAAAETLDAAGPDAGEVPAVGTAAGPRFGEYELLEKIGEGGMGEVYRARHTRLKRQVALKLIRAGLGARKSELERFRVEAEAAARLSHPGIVQVYEVGDHDGRPFLALEYCDGGSLAAKLGGQPVQSTEAAEVVRELADAVHAAHQRHVVHRDLKPANVLLTADGRLKVTDFGLAKCLDADGGLTRTDAVMGTPPYMAPEQADGTGRPVGPWTDVYALGAILYELLTGRPPFRGATPTETLHRVVHEEPTRPRQRNRSVPLDLETVCLRCLEKDPPRRFATAGDLADELGRYLRGEPIRSRPVGVLGRGWRWSRRNRAVAGLLTAVILVLTAGVVTATLLALYARDAKVQAEAAREVERVRSYVAFMNGADRYLEAGDLGRLQNLLRAHIPGPGQTDLRGWEWYYLQGQCRDLTTLGQHAGGALAVAWHPDHRHLATAGADGTIRVWDARDQEPVREQKRHAGPVRAIAWSPNGDRLASAGDDGVIHVSDPATGKAAVACRGHDGPVHAVAWGGNGRLASGGKDGTVRIWNPTTGWEERTLRGHKVPVNAVAWNPDGTRLASGGGVKEGKLKGSGKKYDQQSGEVKAWAVADGREVHSFRGHAGVTNAMAWSPDGTRIATTGGYWDHAIYLWDPVDGEPLLSLPRTADDTPRPPADSGTAFEGHNRDVYAAAWSPDGRWLASSGRDGLVVVWDATDGSRVRGWQGLGERVAWSGDGRNLASADADGTVRVWRAPGEGLWDGIDPVIRAGAIAWSPDGRFLAACRTQPSICRILDVESGDVVREVAHGRWCKDVAWSPDGRTLATGNRHSMNVELWDRDTGRLLRQLPHKSPSLRVAWSPDGRRLAAIQGNELCLWSTATWQKERVVPASGGNLAWSPDGRHIAACGPAEAGDEHSREVVVLDAETGQTVFRLDHFDQVFAVAWSPDGRTLATAGDDRSVSMWDAATSGLIRRMTGHSGLIYCLDWSPDGTRLASSSIDHTVKIWDGGTGDELLTLRGSSFSAGVSSVAWSPDGRRLASSGLRIWDVGPAPAADRERPVRPDDPLELRRWHGHTGTVRDIDVSADGKLAVSCGDWPAGDRTVRVWHVGTGTKLRQLTGHTDQVSCVRFVGQTRRAIGAGLDGTLWLWDADTGKLIQKFEDHSRAIRAMDVSADGRIVLAGDDAGAVRVLDLRTGRSRLLRAAITGRVLALAFLPDGERFLSSGSAGVVVLRSVETGRVLRTFTHGAQSDAVAVTPDGTAAVSAGSDGRAVLWELATGKPVRQFTGHQGTVQDVAVSPDGTRLLTAGEDRTVRLWDLGTGKELRVYRGHTDCVWVARFTLDGRNFLSGGGNSRDFDIRFGFVPAPPNPPPAKSPGPTVKQEESLRPMTEKREQAPQPRPLDHMTKYDLARRYIALAPKLYGQPGKADEGEATFRMAIALLEGLCRDQPDSYEYNCWLGAALNNLAIRLDTPPHLGEKKELLEQAVVAQLKALKLAPGDSRSLQLLANHYSNLAGTLLKLGDHEAAAAAAHELRAVPAAAGANATWAANLLADCWAKATADKPPTPARRMELSEKYAAETLSSLRQAVKEGATVSAASLLKHAAMARLLTRREFQQFIGEIEAKMTGTAPEPKAAPPPRPASGPFGETGDSSKGRELRAKRPGACRTDRPPAIFAEPATSPHCRRSSRFGVQGPLGGGR